MQALTDADPRQIADFALVGRLGGGGMGMVYLGRRRTDNLPAAIKVIRPELLADEEIRARFDRETRAAMRVRSPRVAAVLGAGFDEGRAYLACEYIEAPTLDSAIANDGPLAEPALVALAAGLADALIDIHGSGLQHRDLTPRNVLLTYAGPRVIDFGIAYVEDIPSMTSTGAIIGTPGYVAPERLREHLSLPAGDVFAVGALLAFAASGHSPYGGGTPIGIHIRVADAGAQPDLTGVPDSFAPLVRECLAADPSARPDAWRLRDRVAEIAATRSGTSGAVPTQLRRGGPMAAGTPPPADGNRPVGPGDHPAGAGVGGGPASFAGGPGGVGGGPGTVPPTWAETGPRTSVGAVTMADAPPPKPTHRPWWIIGAAVVVVVAAALVVVAPWRNTADTHSGGPTNPPASNPPASTSTTTSASTTPAAGRLAAGTHVLNRKFFDNGLLKLTLVSVRVTDQGEVTANVRYDNETLIAIPLMCALVGEPSTTTLTLVDGTEFRAAHTYCSDHPAAVIAVDPGQAFVSYATFTAVAGKSGPAVLAWQSGNTVTGEVDNIPL